MRTSMVQPFEDIIPVATTAMTLDAMREKIYWAHGKDIFQANIDGTGVEELGFYNQSQSGISGLAVDAVGKNIYWTHGDEIKRGSIHDEEDQEILFQIRNLGGSGHDRYAQGIALDPYTNEIYWFETEQFSEVESSGVDTWLNGKNVGSSRTAFGGPRHFPPPQGVVVLPALSYVEFTAESDVYNESTPTHDLTIRLSLPNGSSLTEDMHVDILDTETGTAVVDTDYAAFPRTTITFPAGSPNGTTQSISLEILDNDEIETDETIELRLSNAVGPALLGLNATHTVTIIDDDVDSPQKLYWVDSGSVDGIHRSNLDGTNITTLVAGDFTPQDIVVDVLRSKMYWSEFGNNQIQSANLDGSEVELFATTISPPLGLSLDAEQQKMYWIEGGATDKIQRANLDGTDQEILIDAGFSGTDSTDTGFNPQENVLDR